MANVMFDEKAIFNVAREIASPDARAEYLRQACGSDSSLFERVQVLLRAYEGQASFLESPPVIGVSPTIDQPVAETPGTVIGPYKLIESIGEGGMGTVWMVQQTEPVKRVVALKLIKAGMDSKQVIARFEAERQALALMDHANIARVLDGGTTRGEPGGVSPGRPYFVMDLVKGVPITRYCDEHHLTPRQRLELFIPVCQALQHAHQKGIIHRDIKPSNVLIALYDGKPVPKVIDFGVAKAAGQSLTDKTLVTGFGNIVGTLEYMSPEQAEINQLDIDTRSDIYSLGVLLYELLAGSPPFTRKDLEKAGMLEMLRVIREQEPSKPSTKLSTAEGLPTLAANRGTEPAKLTRMVRGELDWIVMKALEKDRSRRYETANGFAADVQRYLADEPVQACPPSAAYRFRKFAQRNRRALTTAGVVAVALVLGLLGLLIGDFRVRAETVAKLEAETKRADEESRRADAETQQAKAEKGRADALERWRGTAYYLKTALALNEYRGNNLARAGQFLGECPEDLRHWEWHYLQRLCHGELRTVPLGDHAGYVTAAFSADARRLALVDSKRVLHVYDTATGTETRSIPITRHKEVYSVRFSPDGKRLGICGYMKQEQGVLQVCDAGTGKQLCFAQLPPEPGGNELWGLAFGPGGSHVAAADLRGRVHVINVDKLDELFAKEAHRRDTPNPQRAQPIVQALGAQAFAAAGVPLGSLMHTVAALGTAQVYPLTLEPPPGIVWFTAVAYSPDGKRLATTCQDDPFVKVWNAETGDLVQTFTGGGAGYARLAFSPSGKWLVTAGQYLDDDLKVPDPTVRLWDLDTGRLWRVFRSSVGDKPVWGLAVSPDGRLLATGRHDGTLTIWDVETEREIGTYRGQPRPIPRWRSVSGLAFSADGRQLLALEPGGRTLTVWDATRGAESRTLGNGVALHAACSPDGRLVAAAAQVGMLGAQFATVGQHGTVLWGTETGQELMKFVEKPEWPQAVAFSPDGTIVAAAVAQGLETGMVKLFDVRAEKLLRTLPDPAQGPAAPCDAVAWSPDGTRIASGAQDRVVRMWDAATGRQLWEGKGHSGTISAVAFSHDGRRLTSASGGILRNRPIPPPRGVPLWPVDVEKDIPDLKVWDAATGEEVLSLSLPKKTRALAISPDGEVVAAAFGPSTLSFATGQTPGVGAGAVYADVLEPRDADSTVRLYRVATGQEMVSLKGHTRPCWGVAFSPDGRRLVTAGGDETVKLWDAQTGEEILTIGRHPRLVTSVAFSPDGHKIVSASWVDVRVWDATPLGGK
jgi:WD40 repeat protein/serine/threonine protein kinase